MGNQSKIERIKKVKVKNMMIAMQKKRTISHIIGSQNRDQCQPFLSYFFLTRVIFF